VLLTASVRLFSGKTVSYYVFGSYLAL